MLKSRSRRRKNRSFQPEACEVLEDRKLLSATDINDQFSEAIDGGAMTVAKSGTGAIDFVTDVDMYKFTVEAGQTVEFEVIGSGGVTPRMRLFGHLISNSRPPQELVSTTSTFSHTFTKAGTYYLGISEDANAFYSGQTGHGDQSGPFSKTGDFALTLTPDSTGGSDDDDQISEATGFGKVNARGQKFALRNHRQRCKMSTCSSSAAKANQRIRFDINDTTGGLDTRLRSVQQERQRDQVER